MFAETHAFFSKSIWTAEDEALIDDGVLLVIDGKISAVGSRSEVEVPAGAERHELGNVCLIPGLVVAQSNLVDSAASDPYSISPEVQSVDGFDPFDDYGSLLDAGITTVQVIPNGRKLMPGTGGVVRLGADAGEHILKSVESLLINLNRAELTPTTIYEPPVGAVSVDRPLEPTRPQMATSLSQAVVGLQAIMDTAAEIAGGAEVDDVSLEALGDLLKSKTPVRWDVRNNAEVAAALRLAESYGIPWVVSDPEEIDALIATEVWESELAKGVILTPGFRAGRITNPAIEQAGVKKSVPVWELAHKLITAGAGDRIAVHALTDADLDELLFTSSILGRAGIGQEQILRMLTINPARILGVDDQVGSLAVGKFADFAVLSGSPIDGRAKVVATYLAGKDVSTIEAVEAEDSEDAAYTIHAAKIYSSGGVLEDASISVANGKITGVGSEISSAAKAETRAYADAVVVPGMIDCGTTLGVGSSLSDRLTFGSKIADLLARDDRQIQLGRQGGVTTALLSSTSLPSPVIAFKLGDRPRALKDPVALHYRIRGNLTATEESLKKTLAAGKAYADSWTQYDSKMVEYRKQLKEYEEAKKKYDAAVKAAAAKKAAEEKKKAEAAKKAGESKDKDADASKSKEAKDAESKKPDAKDSESKEADKDGEKKEAKESDAKAKDDGKKEQEATKDASAPKAPKKPDEPKKPRASSSSEPYRALFAGKLVAMVTVEDGKGLELAVQLFRKDFDIKTAIVAGTPAAENAELLADNDVFVVAGPTLVSEQDGELLNFASELAVAGVPFGFQSKAGTGTKELTDAVSYSVYQGLGRSDALEGLTTSPVEFFGLDGVGAIAEGNDADLVILSGSPLDLASEVLAVMIDGKWVYEKE